MDWQRMLTLAAGELIAPQTAAFALAAIGLNVHFGFTGLLNMGHAGFMLLGAYGFAISTIAGAPFWLAFLVAIVAAILFALILGIPTLKLRGDYLAIVTISAAEIIRLLGRSTLFTDLTGASSGLRGNTYKATFQALSPLPDGTTAIGPFEYGNNLSNGWWVRIAAWALVLLAVLVVYLLVRSPWGRVLRGIREDEDAVRALGKSVYAYKMQALVLGGVLGALGGVVYVLPTSVQPDAMGRAMTFFVWTVLLLGGAATIFGPILGAMIFFVALSVVRTSMRELLPSDIFGPAQIEPLSGILIGVFLMLLVIFRPQGIMGDKKELTFHVR
ncbi:branched-chain amino acid ABC transporter permease [Actinotalea sp. BY-33]|uniref:Branched-chain amino acid ABC transporter permease n=1 Tax=Actinotalea soli TaxID=2819234 RepID=A0A939LQM2_9CELL|nr:branched-chain amino acid ABC transporter permease [Actinotalea soli]MBO1750304.1 branched-chain amino acid ABC transporter permease [Actinotalea soli]